VEIADRIGLLVSEEPGLWWSDLKNKAVTDAALEVLHRTILRDRSNVSVAFWLAFNECVLTPEFTAAAASMAHSTDPTRLISGANCMNTADTKKLFTEQGFDFYTYHPYGSGVDNVTTGIGGAKEPSTMARIMQELDDKPLVFTEWGGYWPIGNGRLMADFLDTLISAGKSNEKGKTLAGMSYWQWSDIYETNRGLPGCADGILIEGLVDVDRNPKEDLAVFRTKLLESFYEKEKEPGIEIYGLPKAPESCTVLDTWKGISPEEACKNFRAVIDKNSSVKGFVHKSLRRFPHGPVLGEDIFNLGTLPVNIRKGAPLTITMHTGPVVFSAGVTGSKIYFIGQAGFGDLYPLDRNPRTVAEYTVFYEDGGEFVIPVRNGIEVATVLGSYGPSRLDPRARNAPRAIRICYDLNWELFYINILETELPRQGKIDKIRIAVQEEGTALLLYGITVA
jgi:hypothetical protein